MRSREDGRNGEVPLDWELKMTTRRKASEIYIIKPNRRFRELNDFQYNFHIILKFDLRQVINKSAPHY